MANEQLQAALPVYYVSVPMSEWTELRSDVKTLLHVLRESEESKKAPYLSSSDVCKLLTISPSTLERYKVKGLLVPQRISQNPNSERKAKTKLVFLRTDVERLLQNPDDLEPLAV